MKEAKEGRSADRVVLEHTYNCTPEIACFTATILKALIFHLSLLQK